MWPVLHSLYAFSVAESGHRHRYIYRDTDIDTDMNMGISMGIV